MIRLYVKCPFIKDQEISLSETQSHYIQKVMRLKEGEEILLFNGIQGEWKAKILIMLKRSTILQVVSEVRPFQEKGDIWLLFSPLKSKRQEFLVEKTTELGASCLWPIHYAHTSIPKVNHEKMEAHAIEAAEQSERLTVPIIKPLTLFSDLLKNWPKERMLIFGDETLSAPSLGTLKIEPQKPYAFLVGPEGGFNPQELNLLRSHPTVQGVTLNPYILRAETAALVGLAYLQMRINF